MNYIREVWDIREPQPISLNDQSSDISTNIYDKDESNDEFTRRRTAWPY